jgi:hypothetical protein
MSTIFQYNGVSLPMVKTEKFSQEAVFSPDGVDVIYTKVTVGVGCVLNSCILQTDVAQWIRDNRGKLMERGAQLYYMQDGNWILNPGNATMPTGKELVASPAYTMGAAPNINFTQQWSMDAKLGPKPVRFDIKAIEGGTFLAYYEIETYLPYCETTAAKANYYLSNRWSVDISFDDMYFITRTINGVLILNGQWLGSDSSLLTIPSITMNDMIVNNVIIPPVPNRWKRDAIKISRSSDGLTINYQITDKQLYVSIPRPAAKIDAQYTETAGAADGGGKMGAAMMNCMTCEVNVTVSGQPDSNYDPTKGISDYNKWELMKIMFQVVFCRIPFPFILNGPTDHFKNGATIVTFFQMKEDIFKPIVGCVVRAVKTRTQSQLNIAPGASYNGVFNWTTIGSPLLFGDIINDYSTQPKNIQNVGLLLLTANVLQGQGNPAKNPVGYFTPAELSSALLGPCSDEQYRSIASTIIASGGAGNYNTTTANIPIYTTATYSNTNWSQMGSNVFSNANTRDVYTEYTLDVQYLTDNHIIQLPIMYEPQVGERSCVFAKTAAPTTKKIVHWKAGRFAHWPVSPKPTDMTTGLGSTTTNDELLTYDLTYADSHLLSDGVSRRYETAGVYTCGMVSVLQWDQPGTIPTSVNPITTDVWGDVYSTYPTSLFVSGIIGYGVAPGPGDIT